MIRARKAMGKALAVKIQCYLSTCPDTAVGLAAQEISRQPTRRTTNLAKEFIRGISTVLLRDALAYIERQESREYL